MDRVFQAHEGSERLENKAAVVLAASISLGNAGTISFDEWSQPCLPMGFRAAFERAQPEVVYDSTDNSDRTPLHGAESDMSRSAEIEDFLREHEGLEALVSQAQGRITDAFKGAAISKRIFTDPADGREFLLLEIAVSDMTLGRRNLYRFNHDWWYNSIAQFGHLVGIRLVSDG